MKIKIVDPEVNGRLEVENPNGELCGVTYVYISTEHGSNTELPEVEIHFKGYPTMLGKTHTGF
jgi:hypothetical protein